MRSLGLDIAKRQGELLFRKNSLNTILIVTVLFVVGYLPQLINVYYNQIFQSKILKIAVSNPEVKCLQGANKCSKKYNLKVPGLTGNGMSLVVGKIWTSSEWRCGGKVFFQSGDLSFLSTSRATLNEFFVIDTQSIATCHEEDIEVTAYYPPTQKKSGIMESNIYLADSNTAYKFRLAHEFVSKDYKILNLCVMLLVLLFTFLIQIVSMDKNSKLRLNMSLLLMAGALAQSCILEVFFPYEIVSVMNRWIAMVAYCGYLLIAADYLKGEENKTSTRWHYVGVLVLISLITQDRITTWIWFSLLASIGICFESLKLKNSRLGVLSALTFLTSLEFMGLHGLPNSYIVPTFLAGLVFLENNKAFSAFLKIVRLLKLNSRRKFRASSGNSSRYSTQAIVKLFQKQFKVERMTILSILDTSTIHLQRFSPKRSGAESLQLEELPPVFAHVVTTGNSLINVHADSKLVEDIRRRDNRLAIDADFFTVLPLYSGREVVGAIALTKYGAEQFKTSLSHSTFMFCLDMLKSLLVEHLLTTPKTASLEKITLINKEIAEINETNWKTTEDVIHSYGKIINHTFGWRIACFGQPDNNFLLKHLGCFSFDPEVEERFINGKIYAHRDNQQGPLAIAVHGKKTVIVPNTKWLEGVVHQLTTKFFGIHKTTTAAFVPVFGEDEATVIGVYWIEGIRSNEISYADREMFSSITKSISEKIKLLKSRKQLLVSHQNLSKFIPEHLVEAYLNGEDVQETDYGFLMMFDLKGSTRLSHALGNDTFHKEVDSFKDALVMELEGKWVLRQFVWDGFEFTRSSAVDGSEILTISEWTTAVEDKFEKWKKNLVSQYGSLAEIVGLSFRIVFTFGDVSRGVVEEGATRKWTLKGGAVAVATKVEQASKELEGKVFCDDTIINKTNESWVLLKTTSQGIAVYGLVQNKTIKKAA